MVRVIFIGDEEEKLIHQRDNQLRLSSSETKLARQAEKR